MARYAAAVGVQAATQTNWGAQLTLPQDYVLVHQEYSPATQMQGVGPYLRAVAAPVAEPRR